MRQSVVPTASLYPLLFVGILSVAQASCTTTADWVNLLEDGEREERVQALHALKGNTSKSKDIHQENPDADQSKEEQ